MTYYGHNLFPCIGATSGDTDDWSKGVFNIPYAYTVELRDTGDYGFQLPAELVLYFILSWKILLKYYCRSCSIAKSFLPPLKLGNWLKLWQMKSSIKFRCEQEEKSNQLFFRQFLDK